MTVRERPILRCCKCRERRNRRSVTVADDEWRVGDRVFVPRISADPSVVLKIKDFEGDEDDEDPIVHLLLQEWRNKQGSNIKQELVRQQFRSCRLSELQNTPRKATRGGAMARAMRNLEPIQCGCGCGDLTSGAEFRQGHDAKLKSRLLKIARGKLDGDIEAAVLKLKERGWDKFL
jgi:hypothetical protein